MIYKTIATKPKQRLDQSLISIGGWLRNIDAQIDSFIHSERMDWMGRDGALRKYHPHSDIPEWTYQRNTATRFQKQYTKQDKKWYQHQWYQHLGLSIAAWHTSRDWRNPLSEFSPHQKLGISVSPGGVAALSYAHAYPTQKPLGASTSLNFRSHPFPSLQLPEGLSQFWATSYQLSTALAVLLPIAVNAAQTPSGVNLLAQLSLPINSGAITTDLATKAATPVAIDTLAFNIPAPGQQAYRQPTGLMANIQSYTLPAKGDLTSGYGMRWGRMHQGIDIAGPIGTPIVAAAGGKVLTAGWGDDGFGNKVEIQHPDGTITLYAHTARVLTRVGATVNQGQLIAEMGSTGSSTGPHLHFQIHPGGKDSVDPLFFFAKNKTIIASKSGS